MFWVNLDNKCKSNCDKKILNMIDIKEVYKVIINSTFLYNRVKQ